MFLRANPELSLSNTVYQDLSQPGESAVGADLRQALLDIFARASDRGLFALDRRAFSHNQELTAAISPEPLRFLQNFTLSHSHTALDLSQDFGGAAHFLAGQVGQVEAVYIDLSKAEIAAQRCADKDNVCLIAANLETLDFPPQHYDLIVIGDLESLKLAPPTQRRLLSKLQAALSANGVLILSAVNPNSLNKWFNAHSIDRANALPFAALYQAKNQTENQAENQIENQLELGRQPLQELLLKCNFAAHEVHASFASTTACKAIFSADYLNINADAVNHFYQLGSIENAAVNEFLLYKKLVAEKQNLTDYASRFVLLAAANSTAIRQIYANDFSHFADPAQQPSAQITTTKARAACSVNRQAADAEPSSPPSSPLPFYQGHLLAGEWLSALLAQDNDHFAALIKEYAAWLDSTALGQYALQGCFDIGPSNIIVNQQNGARCFNCFGGKRQLATKIAPALYADFLLFRAIFWFVIDNKPLFSHYASGEDSPSVGFFIIEQMAKVASIEDIAPLIELEETILAAGKMPAPGAEPLRIGIALAMPLSLTTPPSLEKPIAAAPRPPELQQVISLQQYTLGEQYHHLKLLRQQLAQQNTRMQEQQTLADDLRARLQQQNALNDQLQSYLFMRPSTRILRVAGRLIKRVTALPRRLVAGAMRVARRARNRLIGGQAIPVLPALQSNVDYQRWISENALSAAQITAAKAEIAAMPQQPVFSILVPVYNTDPAYLLPMIKSVQAQIYPHWQLCLVDDCSPKPHLKPLLEQQARADSRISIQLNAVNQGIAMATNDALQLATGDYVALLDHDDELSIDALYENAKVINANPEVGLIYSDEDKMETDGARLEPVFKPDYSPDLLHTNNYICHFTVLKKSIAAQIHGFRKGLDGSQDHDLIIRAAAVAAAVAHIPKVLYHWRKIPGSTAVSYDSKSYAWEAGRRAVADQLQAEETGASVVLGALKGTYRVNRALKGTPLISIIIPFKDQPQQLSTCLNTLLALSSYQNFEIIGVNNGSTAPLTHQKIRDYAALDSRIRFIEHQAPLNVASLYNHGVAQAKGKYSVLLNSGIEITAADWLEQLLQHAQRDEIGAVGGKLLTPDGRINHAGIVVGMGDGVGYPHQFFSGHDYGYGARLQMVHNVSAVSGALLMLKTASYHAVGGLDETNLALAYHDVDLCLKLLDKGYRNIYTPHATANYRVLNNASAAETATAATEIAAEIALEIATEIAEQRQYFLQQWAGFIAQGDPYYNPNLSLESVDFALRFKA